MGRQKKESTVDPASFSLRFLGKVDDPVAVDPKSTKPLDRSYGRDRCQTAMALVETYQRAQVDVGHPIAVSKREKWIIADMAQHASDPAAGLGCISGVD